MKLRSLELLRIMPLYENLMVLSVRLDIEELSLMRLEWLGIPNSIFFLLAPS